MKLLLCLSFALLATLCYSYPTGAPESACKNLLPVHRRVVNGNKTSEIVQPQKTTSPYTVTIEPGNIKSGETVKITISGEEFQGFMIRAYDENDVPVNGKFLDRDALQLLKCDSDDDTATHVSKDPKSNFEVQWTSPANFVGKCVFKLTVLKDYETFWQMKSGAVSITN